MRYYWCVNCGMHGDFGFYRARSVKCTRCDYEALCELEEDEYKQYIAEGKDDGKDQYTRTGASFRDNQRQIASGKN